MTYDEEPCDRIESICRCSRCRMLRAFEDETEMLAGGMPGNDRRSEMPESITITRPALLEAFTAWETQAREENWPPRDRIAEQAASSVDYLWRLLSGGRPESTAQQNLAVEALAKKAGATRLGARTALQNADWDAAEAEKLLMARPWMVSMTSAQPAQP